MKTIRLITIGHFASELNLDVIKNWKSKLFKVVDKQQYPLTAEPDLLNWGYSNRLLNKELPTIQQLANSTEGGKPSVVDINLLLWMFLWNLTISHKLYLTTCGNNIL